MGPRVDSCSWAYCQPPLTDRILLGVGIFLLSAFFVLATIVLITVSVKVIRFYPRETRSEATMNQGTPPPKAWTVPGETGELKRLREENAKLKTEVANLKDELTRAAALGDSYLGTIEPERPAR